MNAFFISVCVFFGLFAFVGRSGVSTATVMAPRFAAFSGRKISTFSEKKKRNIEVFSIFFVLFGLRGHLVVKRCRCFRQNMYIFF